MRVVASVPLYPPSSRVGAWLATHRCLAHMAARGHEVDVYVYLGRHELSVLDGVTVHPRTADLDELLARADVVVSHLGDDQLAHRLALAAGKPSVRMIHGAVDEALSCLDGATLAVFNSVSFRQQLAWDGPSIVVHPPVRPEEYRTTPGDRFTLVNLTENKGGQIFDLVAAALPSVKFLGVRGGYGRQAVRPRPNLAVIWPTLDMRTDVYAHTRVLLMPSIRETWGMVGIEAMCSGIPVVAHPTPGLLESLGSAGIFVDRGDLAGWRREVLRLTNPDEWALASTRALDRVDQLDPQADLDRFADALEQIPAGEVTWR